ncbi:hypothetical protein FQZ97_929490 [compost metagenome]
MIKDGGFIVFKPVFVAVLPRKNGGTAGPADGIINTGTVKTYPLTGYPVYCRCFCQAASVSADGLKSMVVGNDDHHVGFFLLRMGNRHIACHEQE